MPHAALSAHELEQKGEAGPRYTKPMQPVMVAHLSAHSSADATGTGQPMEGMSMSGMEMVYPMPGLGRYTAAGQGQREQHGCRIYNGSW